MQSFFVHLKKGEIVFSADDITHIIRVLRKKINNEIQCFDIQNKKLFICQIKSLKPFKVTYIKDIELNFAPPYNINVYIGIIKKHIFEDLIKKLNELNIASITPVWFENSQKNNILNYERINKIIIESCKQCNRFTPLVLHKEINFLNLINLLKNTKNTICAHIYDDVNLQCKKISCINVKKDKIEEGINLVIGSESGFSNNEIKALSSKCIFFKLTPTILRSETAALFLSSIIIKEFNKYEWN